MNIKEPTFNWLVVSGFNAILIVKVEGHIMAVGEVHVFPGFVKTSANSTFLSKATDYFSYMLLQRREAKIHQKESTPQPWIKLTTTRS